MLVPVLLSMIEPPPGLEGVVDGAASPRSAFIHLLWFVNGLLLFFLTSWGGTTWLKLDNDFYYAVFIWVGLTFVHRYAKATGTDLVDLVRCRWRSSLFVGVLASVYLVVNVWNANPTERPDGLLLAFEILWRGVAYGLVDAIVLTVFPLAVATGMLHERTEGFVHRVVAAVLTIVLVVVMSTVYHLGFEQFDDDDLVTPQLATTVVAVPTVVTLNPLGSLVSQVSFSVAVTVQTYESDIFVPPEVEFVPDYEPPGVFGPR